MDEDRNPIEIKISKGVYVDAGIAKHIKSLNKMGYSTAMSCSGLSNDGHEKKKGNRPFISFDRPNSKDEYEKYFQFLAFCFYELNELEKNKIHITHKEEILWYLSIQPFDMRITTKTIGITIYLPFGLGDQKINEKYDELLDFLAKKDYFNKLSKKVVKNGEEIILVL